MSFGQAVSDGFANYANVSGRTARSGYWWWILFTVGMSILASAVDNLVGVTFNESLFGFASVFVGLALIVPLISVTIRRLNDTCEKRADWLGDWIGDMRPVWWLLLSLFCLLAEIFVFIFCLMDSDPGPNKYGPNPNHLTI